MPVKAPETPQSQQSVPLTEQKSPQPGPKDKEEKTIQSTSQDKTTEKETKDPTRTENQQEVNQSSKDETQAGNKTENQSNNKTVVGKDVRNKDIQKEVKRLDSKLFATPEMPEQERKEENEMLIDSSTKTDKTSGTSISDKKSRNSIKQSVIDELRKAGKGKHPVGPRIRKQLSNAITKTDDRRSTFEHKTSKGTLLKGSNVTRANLSRQSSGSSNDSTRSQPKARSTTNSRWTWDDPDLAKHLTIQKVKSDDLMPEPTKAPPNSSVSKTKAKHDEMKATPTSVKSSIEKVRPKKILVKPKDPTGEKGGGRQSIQRRASVTVTGMALGPESPDRPLPERTPSKACNIQ